MSQPMKASSFVLLHSLVQGALRPEAYAQLLERFSASPG